MTANKPVPLRYGLQARSSPALRSLRSSGRKPENGPSTMTPSSSSRNR